MSPEIATLLYLLMILGFFWLDRDGEARPSVALWVPVFWVWLSCSRSVAQWLQMGPQIDPSNAGAQTSPLDEMVYTALMAVGLTVLVRRRKQVWKLLLANGPILLFFLYCALSLMWSDYPDVAFKRLIKALGDVVMIFIVLSDVEPYAAVKRLLARTGYVLIPLSVLFIKYYPNYARYYDSWTGQAYYSGVTTNKNALGAVCLLFGVGAVWRFLAAWQENRGSERVRRLIVQGAILGMVFWLFQIANSMTSISCFLLSSSLLLVMTFRSVARRPVVLHILVATMVLVCSSVAFLGMDPELLVAMGRNPTLTDRTDVWQLLLKIANNPWFGTGFESFWLGPRNSGEDLERLPLETT